MSDATGPSAAHEAQEHETLESVAKKLCTGIQSHVECLQNQVAEISAKNKRNAESVAADRAALENEKELMKDVHKFNEKIKLDVGGILFTASQATLCRVPDSMLAVMFSGRHALIASDDGSYFIDRDGTQFRHILNYLRSGAVSLPADPAAQEELAVEADYYGITELARAVRAPPVDVHRFLDEGVRQMRMQEVKMRQAFSEGAGGSFDPHRGLLSLFDPAAGLPLPLTYQPTDAHPVYLECFVEGAPTHGAPVTVSTLDEFRANFNRLHSNVMHRLQQILQEEPLVIAGGAVLHALTASEGVRTNGLWGDTSDVDLFVHTRDPAEADRIATRVWEALAVDNESWACIRSRAVLNMHSFGATNQPWRRRVLQEKCQLILRLYDSPSEILVGFDCDCCGCLYDGSALWATPRCLRALQEGVNLLNPLHAWPNKPAYEMRLAKYAHRGFSVAVPGLDKERIDYEVINRTAIDKLRGLARLLKVIFTMEAPVGEDKVDWSGGVFPNPRPLDHRAATSVYCRSMKSLRPEALRSTDAAKLIISCGGGYEADDQPVLVPAVYKQGLASASLGAIWMIGTIEHFPLSESSRAVAWAEILDAGDDWDNAQVTRRLHDAWDMGRRSREYLNAEVEQARLESIYYQEAYRDAKK